MLKSCGKIRSAALLVLALSALPARGAFVAVHDWSLQGPGGRYGILACGETMPGEPTHVNCVIICLGPIGEPEVSIEVAAIAASGAGIGLLALAFVMLEKRSHEQRRA
jgi:hypothetical protein